MLEHSVFNKNFLKKYKVILVTLNVFYLYEMSGVFPFRTRLVQLGLAGKSGVSRYGDTKTGSMREGRLDRK